MDYTPYEESLAAINGLPVDLESKPATDFATYIQTLLDNPAPRGFMLSGRAPATAEEELELKKAEEVIKKLVPASMFAGEGDAGDGFGPADNGTGFSMGIGKATDAIVSDAMQAAAKGFMKGGLTGAVLDGLFSYGSGMLGLQQQINDTTDPLGTWSVLQGWAPVPVETQHTTYSPAAIAEANNNEANQMNVDPGVEAAVAANDAAKNAAEAQALAAQGIGIDAFGGSGNSSSGGGGYSGPGGVGGTGVSPGGGNAAGGYGFGGW